MAHKYNIGEVVHRKEAPSNGKATVLSVLVVEDFFGPTNTSLYLLQYEEGGEGYWPEDTIYSGAQ